MITSESMIDALQAIQKSAEGCPVSIEERGRSITSSANAISQAYATLRIAEALDKFNALVERLVVLAEKADSE